MEIKKVQFIKGVVGEESIMYDGTPHIAFVGRSNVGKSSTLNALFGTKKMVKTGKTPGKTKEINFFNVIDTNDHQYYFVDLPGYGYAKLSKNERVRLENLIHWYLLHPESDTDLVCIIIDAQVGITEFDEQVITTMISMDKPFIIGVNKIDRLNQKEQSALKKLLDEKYLNQYVFYSAKKDKHINRLLDGIESCL